MSVLAVRGSKAWLAGSAALAICLMGASVAVLRLTFPLTYEARALVLLEPGEAPVAALPGAGPDRATRSARRETSPRLSRALDALFAPGREPSARPPGGSVKSRLLEGGRLVEISASAADPETAAAIANGTAGAFVGEGGAAPRSSLALARTRARAAATLTEAAPHPLDSPLLGALRRALSEMARRRDKASMPFAVIGEAEMSARRQIAREVSAIRRRAAEDLARALSRDAATGRSAADPRPARVLVARASAADAVRRSAPASERAALAGSAVAVALLFALFVLLATGSVTMRRRRRA
jgi:hypothetical protein